MMCSRLFKCPFEDQSDIMPKSATSVCMNASRMCTPSVRLYLHLLKCCFVLLPNHVLMMKGRLRGAAEAPFVSANCVSTACSLTKDLAVFAPSQVATDHAAHAALGFLDTKPCCPQLLVERVCVAFRQVTSHMPHPCYSRFPEACLAS